jgi:hypothetical protein
MKYYIMQNETGTGFEIVKVHPEDDANFQADYGQRVVAEADDLAGVLKAFAAHNERQW